MRNISKHKGSIIEPQQSQEFYSIADETISSLTKEVFGKSLLKIYASELIKDEEIKNYLIVASEYIVQDKIYEALEYIRRAFYKVFETPYCIASWENSDPITGKLLRLISRVPSHVKNEKFIENDIKDPFDYIQHNFRSISLDLLNYGIPKEDFLNVYRLTPRTIFCEKSKSWKSETNFTLKIISKEQAKYLLGLTIDMIKKKEKYQDSQQALDSIKQKFVITQDTKLYEKASSDSVPLFEVKKGEEFEVEIIVPPLQGDIRFVQIEEMKHWNGKRSWISGYILETDGIFPKIKYT